MEIILRICLTKMLLCEVIKIKKTKSFFCGQGLKVKTTFIVFVFMGFFLIINWGMDKKSCYSKKSRIGSNLNSKVKNKIQL